MDFFFSIKWLPKKKHRVLIISLYEAAFSDSLFFFCSYHVDMRSTKKSRGVVKENRLRVGAWLSCEGRAIRYSTRASFELNLLYMFRRVLPLSFSLSRRSASTLLAALVVSLCYAFACVRRRKARRCVVAQSK